MTTKIKRYSDAFRRQVVAEYEAGAGIPALKKKYNIQGTDTLPRWIRKFGTQGFRHEIVHIQLADEAQRVKDLEKQVQELEQALGRVTLEKLKLESILEEFQGVSEQEVKKNEPPSSTGCGRKPSNSKLG